MLKKYKLNREIEIAPVYFNSVAKTVINHRFKLESSFQEILFMIDVWVNKGSGWNVESAESQYIIISTFRPLSGGSCINLPVASKIPRKGLINIKNKDEKFFFQKALQKLTKKLSKNLIMMELSFQCKKRILTRLK